MIAQLLFLEADNPRRKSDVHQLARRRGDIGPGDYDTMQFIRPAVSDAVHGAGSLDGLAAAGSRRKDMRFLFPNPRIMVHQPSGGFRGQASDIMLHAQEILILKKRLNEIYVKHTGQSYKAIEDALERDKFLTAEDAKLRPGRQGDRQTSGRPVTERRRNNARLWTVTLAVTGTPVPTICDRRGA